MPNASFPCSCAGGKVGVRWDEPWRNLVVVVAGREIGPRLHEDDLRRGVEVAVGEGAPLRLHLEVRRGMLGLRLDRGGTAVGFTYGDTARQIRYAGIALAVTAGLLLVVGLFLFQFAGDGPRLAVAGLALLATCVFAALSKAAFRGSPAAMQAGFALVAAETAVEIVLAVQQRTVPNVIGGAIRFAILYNLWRGIFVARALAQQGPPTDEVILEAAAIEKETPAGSAEAPANDDSSPARRA